MEWKLQIKGQLNRTIMIRSLPAGWAYVCNYGRFWISSKGILESREKT